MGAGMPNIPQFTDEQMNEMKGLLDEETTEEVTSQENSEQVSEAIQESEQPQNAQESAQAQKIKIGNNEYSQEELDELVGLGSRAREVGSAHGGFDKFVSEFGKKSQTIGNLKRELEEAKKPKDVLDSEAEIEQARAAARRLGIVLQDDLENYYSNRRSGERLLENCRELENSVDGSDGRPKFNTQEVLEFMAKNESFTDPKKAYEAMHLDEIAGWKAEKLRVNKGGISTITNTPSIKAPQDVKANRDNLRDLISEALR